MSAIDRNETKAGTGEQPAVAAEFPKIRRTAVILCLLISLVGIADHDLWTPDEPREAALALHMQRTREWAVPRLAGTPFVEKPPLFYIIASQVTALFGRIIGCIPALRLTSALFGLGTLGMTFLIGRRLWGKRAGILAMLALSLMPGFVQVTHWILVDNALMFFTAAALWCLLEAFAGQRPVFLAPAGLFAAGAFLSKGFIGPLVIALGAAGLLAGAFSQRALGWLFAPRGLAWLALAAAFFALPAGVWILALRNQGGPELWREWFWSNQFGRFSGQASQLGHVRWAGYYLIILPVYILPWLAAWLLGTGRALRGIFRREQLENQWSFLLCWALGGLALLTVSSSKREIYLAVLLPAFALTAAAALREPPASWARLWMRAWRWPMLALPPLLACAPFIAAGLGMELDAHEKTRLALTGLITAAAAGVAYRRTMPWLSKWLTLSALAYISFLAICCPLLDRFKSYGPAFRELAARIAAEPEARPAAWQFDETTRAGFYFYCDLVFPPLSDKELTSVLAGVHPSYNAVLVTDKHFPPAGCALPPWRTVGESRLGPTRRLLWIGADTRAME